MARTATTRRPTAPSANVPFSTVDLRVGTGAEATTGRTRHRELHAAGSITRSAPTTRASRSSTRARFQFHRRPGRDPGIQPGHSACASAACAASIDSAEPWLRLTGRRQQRFRANATLIFEIELLAVQYRVARHVLPSRKQAERDQQIESRLAHRVFGLRHHRFEIARRALRVDHLDVGRRARRRRRRS